MQTQPHLNFHHNFSEPVKIPGSHGLFYDPVRIDEALTKLLINGDRDYETPRNTSTARR